MTRTDIDAAGEADTPVHDGQWHHLALTRRASDVRLYVDGRLAFTDAGPAGATGVDEAAGTSGDGLPLGDAPLFVGACNNTAEAGPAEHFFLGAVDDVRIWNRALSAAEVAANAIARVVKPTPALTGAQKGAIEAADRLGVKLTAGEASGNRALKWAEAASSDMPFAAGIATRRIAGNAKALARAAAQSMGQQADEISEGVFSAARQELSGKFDALLKPIQIDLSDKAIQTN